MLQAGGDLDLAQEPIGAERRRQLLMQHLDRDRAVVLHVLGEEYGRHAALAQLALHGVPAGESGP